MLRIAHFSDLHFCAKNLDEAARCFGFAVSEAIAREVDVAVISGDATDHALDVHSPAVRTLAQEVRRLADSCPVLMLQGTYSHEPPGTLSIFPLLGGRHPVLVADRLGQVALMEDGRWLASQRWRFDSVPRGARALFTCIPTVNKADVAAVVGALDAAEAVGHQLAALLVGYATVNEAARAEGVPTLGVAHGTVSGCVTEHGVPMAGFDHEFTTTSLFSARAQAFLLGHIHQHQAWQDDGRWIAYAGSIGRFHHGEREAKGFLLWQVAAASTNWQFIATPARRTVDLVFEGAPDPTEIERAVKELALAGAWVRVRWQIGEEERSSVDRDAIRRVLADAADVQLEGRVVPVVRSRAEGISQATSLAEKVRRWGELASAETAPLLERLAQLAHAEPARIAEGILAGPSQAIASDPEPVPAHDESLNPQAVFE